MIRHIGGLVFRAVSTLLIVLVIAFFISRIAYRNPAAMLAPRNANQQTIDAVAHALRLNEPWYQQLWYYLYRGPDIQGAAMGLTHWPPGLGYSFRKQTAVTELILSKVPVTLSLALGALVIWMTLSIILGVVAARRQGTWVDNSIAGAAYVCLSVPTFLSGILISYFLFFQLSNLGIFWFPSSGYVPLTEGPFQWVVRASMLEVLSEDYIRTARAKGLPEGRIYYDHALKAALNPVITLAGLELAVIMGGAIVTEAIFGLDGVGRLAINSALDGDFPVVIGTTIFAAACFVFCTLVVDVIARWRDPAHAH